MSKNKNLNKELILEAFEKVEQGLPLNQCFIPLGISRKTFHFYMTGDLRYECREEHVQKYPQGKISQYRGRDGSRYLHGTH